MEIKEEYWSDKEFGLWKYPLYKPLRVWDMFNFNAKLFFEVLSGLSIMEASILDLEKASKDGIPENLPRMFNIFLDHMDSECKQIGLLTTCAYIASLKQYEGSRGHNAEYVSHVQKTFGVLKNIIQAEIYTKELFLLDSNDSENFRHNFPFGEEVQAHFPSASYDIKEAAKCLALDRNTACVMHLMRALEVGLGVLAKELDIPYERKNWDQIINKIPPKIKEIENKTKQPRDWRELRQFYSEAAERFMLLKNADRNESMHPNKIYGREQAKDIFSSAKAFMQTLAGRLMEKKIV